MSSLKIKERKINLLGSVVSDHPELLSKDYKLNEYQIALVDELSFKLLVSSRSQDIKILRKTSDERKKLDHFYFKRKTKPIGFGNPFD